MATTQSPPRPGARTYVVVWIALLGIVGTEVLLTYAHLHTGTLLAALLALALLEAGIALLYFMHLRYERAVLFWSLVPGLIFVLLMLDQLWPDALRLITLRHSP